MEVPKSYKGLKSQYNKLDESTRNYLGKLDPLLQDGNNFEIALAYCFMKLEEGHHRALKCGLIRIHACDSATTDKELNKQHFTHEKFLDVFKNIFSSPIPNSASKYLNKAQDYRNKQIHGKSISAGERRAGIHYALLYMQSLGEFVEEKTKKNPYGNLQGLQGRKDLLPAKSTIWMLKGFGLGEKQKQNQ